MCPNLLSRDISNLKQLKICIKHFKQAQESSRCGTGDKSSADTSGWAAQGEPFSSAAPKEQEKKWGFTQGSCRHRHLGADLSEPSAELDPGLQLHKSCHK